MTNLSDLITPMTSDQVKKSIYTVIGKVGVDVTIWKPGAVVRTIIAAVAIILAALTTLISLIATSGFLSLASGVWLTLVARYVFGVERNLATFGTGTLTLTNTGGGMYTLNAGAYTVVNLDTGKTYHNVAGFTLNPNATLTINIIADEVGAASTSGVGNITGQANALNGVLVSNPTAVVGTDDELDPDLQLRCLDKLGSFSPNGPSDAYAFVARSALRPDGSSIGVNRVIVTNDGFGNVFVTLATASGPVPGDQNDPTTDLGMIRLAMLQKATPLCVVPYALSATPVQQALTFTAYAYNTQGLTSALLLTAVTAALAQLFATLPLGGHVLTAGPGFIFLEEFKAAMTAAVPSLFRIVFTIPATDPTLVGGQVLTLGAVTGTVQFVSKQTL